MTSYFARRRAGPYKKKGPPPPPFQLVYNSLIIPEDGRPTDQAELLEPLRDRRYLIIASIDPGKKNVGFRVEKRYLNPLDSTRFLKVKTLVWERLTTSYTPSGGDQVIHIYADLIRLFDKHLRDVTRCDLVMVEHQLTLARREIIQVQQHITTYFMLRYPKAIIVDLDSHLKGGELGYDPSQHLKKWSIALGNDIMVSREDKYGLSKLARYKSKQDDLTDTLLQIEAFCRHINLGADWISF